MDISARFLVVPLVASALFTGANARAQDNWGQPPMFNPPPPDVVPGSTYSGPHSWMARTGPQLGLRVAYALGTGDVYSGLSLRDSSSGALPVTVDLGWRFLPQLYAGIYGSFAPVFLKTNPISCPAGFDCNAQNWRFGVQFDYHFVPRSRLDPYVGLGGGYEILRTNANGVAPVPLPTGGAVPGNVNAYVIDRGWEFANLTLGFDARIDPGVGIGPYISGSLNEYNVHTGNQYVNVSGTQVSNTSVTPVNSHLHELFFAGVRGTFNP